MSPDLAGSAGIGDPWCEFPVTDEFMAMAINNQTGARIGITQDIVIRLWPVLMTM